MKTTTFGTAAYGTTTGLIEDTFGYCDCEKRCLKKKQQDI